MKNDMRREIDRILGVPPDAMLNGLDMILTQEIDTASEGVCNELNLKLLCNGFSTYLVIEGRWALSDEAEVREFTEMLLRLVRDKPANKTRGRS